jgi:hypothetical protein
MSHAHFEKCGCLLQLREDKLSVKFCPLHAAAPAMREALKKLVEPSDGCDTADFHPDSHLGDCVELARVALAQAEGKEK